jgi:hypothetical protein
MPHDILKALMMLRASFQKSQLDVPVAIVLKDADEGMRLMLSLRKSAVDIRQYVEEDMVMSSMKVMGIEVRWPAKKFLMDDGEVVYR